MIKWEKLKDFSGFCYDGLVLFNKVVLYVREEGKEKGKIKLAILIN